MLRGNNLSENVGTRLDEADLVYLDPDLAAQFSRSVARRGDLIFTCWGTVGQVGFICESSTYEQYVVSNKQMKMTPDPRKVLPLYLYYYLSQPHMIDHVRSQSIGSSVPGFNLGQLRRIQVCIPDLPEQVGIAKVLGALDDKIAANGEIVLTIENLLSSEFAALGMYRDPDPSNRTIRLDQLIELNPPLSQPREGEPIYVDMQKLPTSGMSITDWSRRPAKGGVRFQNGDTLLARITPCLENRKTGYVDFLDDGQIAIGSTEYIVMRSKVDIPPELSYFLAISERFRAFAIRHMVGSSGRQRVSAINLTEFEITQPDQVALEIFGRKSAKLFDLIRSQRDETRTLTQLRDTLLPELMSGRIRVKDAEESVGEMF